MTMVIATARPSRAATVRHLGPHWYACVMGTAVVAAAGAVLPARIPGLRTALAAVWALSLVLLVALLTARALHWARHRAQLLDPAVLPFYGCLSMALLAVGGGALAVGRDWIGTRPAVALDAVLYAVLVAAWVTAALHTARGPVSGALLAGPGPAPSVPRPATARTR